MGDLVASLSAGYLWFSLPMTIEAAPQPVDTAPLVLAGVLLCLVVILLASKLGGEICARVSLPPVLGELVGGVVVGISGLHFLLFPDGSDLAVGPSTIAQLLQWSTHSDSVTMQAISGHYMETLSILSELGVIFLLFEIGLESNLKELIRVGPQAALVAVVGVALPFLAGTAGLIGLFGVPTVPAIFAGAALTATSIGITAKVLAEIQRLNTNEGQIIVGAAVLDDILGIIVLAVVASLAKDGHVEISNIVYLVVSATVFLVGSIVLGRLLSPYFVWLVDRLNTRGSLLIAALIVAFVWSYIAAAIQLEAILGAFTAGLILAETEKQSDLEEQVLPISDMLVPIFFVCVGARTDISVLNPLIPENREGLILAVFLIVVAVFGKLLTGATVFGPVPINRWAIGIGMIPRGEVGLVFAGVGTSSGVLSPALSAAIIVMVIVTTFLAPPLLRWVFQTSSS